MPVEVNNIELPNVRCPDPMVCPGEQLPITVGVLLLYSVGTIVIVPPPDIEPPSVYTLACDGRQLNGERCSIVPANPPNSASNLRLELIVVVVSANVPVN